MRREFGPSRRDAHAKAHGCLKADFSVKARYSCGTAQGRLRRDAVLYAPGSVSPTVDGKLQDDAYRDGRGMAIKLTGVEGPKLLAHEAEAKTQDFVMINSPAFFIRNARDYVSFLDASKYRCSFPFFLTHWHELRVARAIVRGKDQRGV